MTRDEAEWQLKDWARSLHYGVEVSSTVLQHLLEEGRDERTRVLRRRGRPTIPRKSRKPLTARGKESRFAGVKWVTHDGVAFASTPDGGAGALVDRLYFASIKAQRRQRVADAVERMPDDMRHLITLGWERCASALEVPREAAETAKLLGVSMSTYHRRKREMLAWLARELGLASAPAEEVAVVKVPAVATGVNDAPQADDFELPRRNWPRQLRLRGRA